MCIVTYLPFLSKISKSDFLYWYTILRVHSCKLLIPLFKTSAMTHPHDGQ